MAEPSPSAISSSPCHLGGLTRLAFAPDGQTIFTGGSDCLVRIHKANEPDSEPGFHDNHEDAVTSLSCAGSTLITASLDNIARTFSYPQNEYTGYVTRSASVPIRWVSLDKAGDRVAVCSDDLLVKVVHVKDTTRVSLLSDNTKSVRSATWDPTGKYLTTVGCDGKVKIYDMSDSTPLLLKIIEGVVASSESDSNTSCYAAWSPSGTCFAVPTRTNEIAIINKDGWTRMATISPEGPKSAVGELAWSPNGRYLASASGSQITVFTMDTRQPVAKYTNSSAITGLSFSPISNLLAFTAFDGAFTRWNNPIPSNLTSPTVSDAVQAKTLDRLLDDEFGEGDDGLDIEERGEDIVDDWIVDDDGGAYGDDDGEGDGVGYRGKREVVNVTKAQPPFAPGSTSMKNKKRYLAFNMIGVVDVTDQETHQVINVEFHDKSARRGYHFQDHHKYTMASLGEQGIVYASTSDSDEPSQVYYRPYDSWASQSDWTLNLLPDEDALVVAAGGDSDGMGSVIVATTKGYVRFFSSSGIQRYLWRVGEEVVSMTAGKEAVMLVHREGGTSLDGCQNLRYSIVDLESFEIVQEGKVPLPRKALLSWIGFSRDGVPAMYDSTGLLSILDRYRRPGQARWVPLFDSSLAEKEKDKGRKEITYWPVGMTDSHFTCVILKGEKEPWFPRPLIQEVGLVMPLLNMDNEQGKREEAAIRGEMTIGHLRDSQSDENSMTIKQTQVALDKELLQLVQGACKADNLQRALDLTRLMHNPASVDAAAKIAGFYHLPGLQERMGGVKEGVERKRRKVEKKRVDPPIYSNSNGHAGGGGGGGGNRNGAGFNDFAPRNTTTARRSFGGKVRDRYSTPANPTSNGNGTYIPETPGTEVEMDFESTPAPALVPETSASAGYRSPSPEMKRKRDDESFAPIGKKVDPSFKEPAKNPFAKKSQPSNPFAKPPPSAKPLEAIKSTSFFERVDTIESSGVGAGVKTTRHPKRKEKEDGVGARQQTLFAGGGGLKKGVQKERRDSMAVTETDPDESLSLSMDVDGDGGDGEGDGEGESVLQEAQVQSPVEETDIGREASPEWDETQDDVEL